MLRNISIQNGLWIGNRLEVVAMERHCITAVLVLWLLKGKHVLIPRRKQALSDPNLPFTLERHQFPVRLAYAMTQELSFEKVGLYLPDAVFSHNQLYAAFS